MWVSDDEDLFLTQSKFSQEENTEDAFKYRFGILLSEAELQDKLKTCVPKGTKYKHDWALSVFKRWQEERRQRSMSHNILLSVDCLTKNIFEMEVEDINTSMKYFVFEARKVDGSFYPTTTLYGLYASLSSIMKSRGRDINLFEDKEFTECRQALDAVMRERSAVGLGSSKVKSAEIISEEEENLLWEKGILGDENPQQLLDTILYLTGLNFALRGGMEHRSLRLFDKPQITGPHSDTNGKLYLSYKEDTSKTNPGGLKQRKVKPKEARAYQNIDNPERCYVRMFQKYKDLCAKSVSKKAFYFTPMKTPTDEKWFIDCPVGHNTLQSTVKRICEIGGIQGRKTNHSLRATAATRLYQGQVDEQLICEQTGHRSNAVRTYKRTSDAQKEVVSSILTAKKSNSAGRVTMRTPTATVSKNPSTSNPTATPTAEAQLAGPEPDPSKLVTMSTTTIPTSTTSTPPTAKCQFVFNFHCN